MGAALLILSRRMTANRRLLAALLLGVLTAATLLASAPIYARAMADTGLGYALTHRLGTPPTTRVITYEQGFPLGTPEARTVQTAVAQRIRQRLGWFSKSYARYVRPPAFTLAQPGQPVPAGTERPLLTLQSFDGLETHVRVTAGALPQPVSSTSGVPEFQIAVSASAAAFEGLKPGDHVLLADAFDDCERHPPRMDQPPDPPCTPHTRVSFSVPALITGLVEPLQSDDPLWVDGAEGYFKGTAAFPGEGARVPAFLPAASMDGAFADLFAGYWATQQWFAFADSTKLTRDNYKRAQAEIAALNDDMNAAGLLSTSPLPGALQDFNTQFAYDQTPLLLLLLQITGIALFYVAIVGAMIVERQAPETALLRGRGASIAQVLGVYALEGLVLALPCALLGPYLGVLFTRLLGKTPAFHSVTGGALLSAHVDAAAFGLAGIGALLSICALLVPAFFSARSESAAARRLLGRPQPALVQRYYLDLALAAVCGMLLWELQTKGTVFKPGNVGGLSSDPLLLLSPALLTLAVAALALRLYPPALRLAARLAGAGSGVTVMSGLRQLTRNPAQYTRLGLLLMMGVAVGAFAASYSDTTTRSLRERVLYRDGVDIRASLSTGPGLASPAATDARFAAAPGVAQASSVLRLDGSLGTPGSQREQVQVLALDPAAARSLLWYRAGLSPEPLDRLMAHLGQPTPEIGKPLPGQPASFSLWVRTAGPRPNTTVWVRVRDANGSYSMFDMGKLDFTGWTRLATPLSSVGHGPKYPASLVAIVLTEPSATLSIESKSEPLYFDDFAVTQPDGQVQTVEDFEGIFAWKAALTNAGEQDEAAVVDDVKHGGAHALRFSFPTGPGSGVRGFYIGDPNVPLPVVASRDFARQAGVGVGGSTTIFAGDHLVPIRIEAIADLFPTLDPRQGPYVLLNRIHLAEWLPRIVDSSIGDANEIWLQAAPGADRADLVRRLNASPYQLQNLLDRGKELELAGADPLLVASGSGVLLIAFVAALALTAGCFLVTLFTSLRRRRIEFAVMAALGLGRRHVLTLLAFEFAIIAAIGAGIGLVLGLAVSRVMLSFLTVTETGAKVTPPFVLVTNWSVIAVALGVLATIVVLSLALAARIFTAGSASAVLRGAE